MHFANELNFRFAQNIIIRLYKNSVSEEFKSSFHITRFFLKDDPSSLLPKPKLLMISQFP